MFIDYTPEETKLKADLRAYFQELVTPELLDEITGTEGGGPLYTRALRRMGADGWLGIGWPVEVGGRARPAIEQYIFFDEVQRAGFPIPFLTLCTVGPTLMKFGTDEQRARMLPAILRGELHFAIGYSEPEAGTDLASLKTRAVRDGDDYVVHGQKVFTSLAEYADYIWLAVRTDPVAPKHKGISILCVPTSADGFEWTPIVTVGGQQTTATYYRDVRVPAANLVGQENEGWRMITTQLNHERVGLAAWSGMAAQLFDEVAIWAAATTTGDGRAVIDREWVRLDLARARCELEAMRLLNWRMATAVAAGRVTPAESSAVKVFGTERILEIYRLLLGVSGAAGYLQTGSPEALLAGRLEEASRQAQINTFGGGVNEVQREIVAMAGLGMRRSGR